MNRWIDRVKQIRAISQAGLTYSKDKFDIERFVQLEAIAADMFAHLSSAPVEQVTELFLPETGYPTPKIDLRAGVIRDGQILLVREREDGLWTLPGGWADVCESPSEGVIREVLEESGYVVANPRLVAVKDRDKHPYLPKYPFHIYKLFFLCDWVGGKAQDNLEISEIGFFAPDALPPLSLGRVSADDIAMLFEYSAHPDQRIYVD